MTDFVALAVLLLVIAAALALASRRPLAWAIEEWRLMRADTFCPTGRPQITGPTLDEEAVQRMDVRLRALNFRMRDQGRTTVAGKAYVPVLTKPVEPKPPKAYKVVPIRRVA